MILIRYIVALGAWGTMALAGALIAAFSGLTMFEMATRAANYFGTGGQVTESSSISFLVQFFAFWSVLALAGLGLFWFGARGVLGRIRAGLPSAEEGVGRSPLARTLLGIVFGLAFLWGAVGFAVGIAANVDFAILGFTGVAAEGKATTFRSTDDQRRWTVTYEFHTPDGATYTGMTMATSRNPDPPRLPPLPVIYDPANPAHNEVFADNWLVDILIFLVTRGLVALAGLSGVIRNIWPGSPKPEADGDQATEPPAPVPSPSRMRAATPRSVSFGRRGA